MLLLDLPLDDVPILSHLTPLELEALSCSSRGARVLLGEHHSAWAAILERRWGQVRLPPTAGSSRRALEILETTIRRWLRLSVRKAVAEMGALGIWTIMDEDLAWQETFRRLLEWLPLSGFSDKSWNRRMQSHVAAALTSTAAGVPAALGLNASQLTIVKDCMHSLATSRD